MNIGVNGRTFSVTEPDGAVQSSLRLTKELSDRGHDVTVFGSRHASLPSQSITHESTGYPITSQLYGTLWERSVLPLELRRHSLDVFYAPNGNAPLHQLEIPTVMCIHDVNAQLGFSSRLHYAYRRLTVPRAAKAADVLTTVSEFSKQEISTILSIPPSKIHVVYNGIDEFFLTDGGSEPLALPENYVLFVGAMNPRKNITRAIRAYKRAKNEANLPHQLLLVGPKNTIVFKNLELGTDDDVTHLGYLSQAQLKYVYEQADCLLYPSLYEGFGIPPLEAMACGTPVVGSQGGALPEILADAAELPDPSDSAEIAAALLRLLTNEDRRQMYIARGEARSRQFTWDRAAARLEHVCQQASIRFS